MSWFGRRCVISGRHIHFCKKRMKLVSGCIKRCIKELWISLIWPSPALRKCSSNGTQFLPKIQDVSEVPAEEHSGFISAEDWPSGSPDFNIRYYILWVVLKDMACRKRHNNPDSLKRSLVKKRQRSPWRQRVAIAEWLECLKAWVQLQGSEFEWH